MASVDHGVESAAAVARDLLGMAVDAIEPITRGRNSRVYRIAAGADGYALKQYPISGEDARDRLGTEVDALRLMQQLGVPGVPRVIAADAARRFALLTWIEGTPVGAIADADIDAAGDFLLASSLGGVPVGPRGGIPSSPPSRRVAHALRRGTFARAVHRGLVRAGARSSGRARPA
jgi:Ser/Thr protein kinase RdoA (MazF antagonist)